MKNEIKIPSMGESITEATIGTIMKKTGTVVEADDEILELETDKVNQVLYAPTSGVVTLKVKSDDVVKIGDVIGHVDAVGSPEKVEPQEKVESTDKEEGSEKEEPQEKIEPTVKEEGPEEKVQEPQEISTAPVTKKEVAPSGKVRNTQASFIKDVLQKEKPKALEEKETLPKKTAAKEGRETRKKMSRIRKVIAARLVEATQTTAMLTTFNEIDLTKVIEIRSKYKEIFLKKFGVKLGFMSFFVKACVEALKAFPEINSYIEGDEVIERNYFDIGIAVGTEKGLIVPVVRNCEQLSFAEIETEIVTYANKARDGTIRVDDLQGGGFTITNGGVYGSLLSTPILNPPQSGILGMHKIEKRPVVIDDTIVIRSMMYLALSYDHRIVDGKEAVSFLVHIKEKLEDPSRFVLGV